MTSYNRENLIRFSIESVLAQEYNDFEFIIVDDASTDTTWEIILEYAQKDQRINAYRNNQNQGDYANRNIAASYANRKYLKYLDSDDILFPYALKQMVHTMEANPTSPIGLVGVGLSLAKKQTLFLTPYQLYKQIFFKGNIIASGPSFSILRRNEFVELGGFSTKRHLSDTEFWLKILAKYPACIFDESLVFWREHDSQEFKIGLNSNYHLFNAFHIYFKYLSDNGCPLPESEREYAIRNLKNRYSRKVLLNYLLGKFGYAKQLRLETKLSFSDLLQSCRPNKYPN
jgi:glycosyltransferase involved in cell wall biosynthesis